VTLRKATSKSAGSLKVGQLSQWETIGQSLASIAPTGGPAMLIPLVLVTSGRGTWLVFLLATIGVACIGREINAFARRSSSPGSLYTFVREGLSRGASVTTGWALLVAYIATASAVTGGITNYLYSLFRPDAAVGVVGAFAITCVAVLVAGFLAYRDVQVSARLMLIIEAVSILAILLLFFIPGHGSAIHFDKDQWLLTGVTFKQVRSGLVLAVFAYVGFESATSLGEESVNPLKTIPSAVRWTVWASGIFFIIASYSEDIGFAHHAETVVSSSAPLHVLAVLRGLPLFSPVLAATTVCSFFACTLACINAGARTLFMMSRDGFLPARFGDAHHRNQTPHVAVVCVSAATLATPLVLIALHSSPMDIYGWLGTFATFGFLTAYAGVAISGAVLSWRSRNFRLVSLLSLACATVILTMCGWSAFEPGLDAVYRRLPFGYIALVAVATALTLMMSRRAIPESMAPAALLLPLAGDGQD
jgi:amino acid transporter